MTMFSKSSQPFLETKYFIFCIVDNYCMYTPRIFYWKTKTRVQGHHNSWCYFHAQGNSFLAVLRPFPWAVTPFSLWVRVWSEPLFFYLLLLWAHLIWGLQKKPELFIIRMNTDPSVFIASVWSPVLAQGQGSPVTIVIGIPKDQQIPSTYLHFPIKAKGLFSSILSWGEEQRVCAQWDGTVENEKWMMQDYVGTCAQGVVSLSGALWCSAPGETVVCLLRGAPWMCIPGAFLHTLKGMGN